MRQISLEQFHAELRAQGVPKIHLAFKCPICGTIQSAHDLIKAITGSDFDAVQKYIGFSCVGRYTNAGPFDRNRNPPVIGCDWTLGGLLRLHTLEVMDEGEAYPRFELATPEEAKIHACENGWEHKLRCFLDTEFIESGRHFPIQLISIGIVTSDGREFYAESQEFDPNKVSPWLKENVLPHLGSANSRKPVALIQKEVREFIGDAKPEFWGYYADYDWVVFCQIFGSMIELPKGWPMYCRDIKQLCDSLGNPELPKHESTEHNALNDARWNKLAFQQLKKLTPKRI